MRHRSERYGDRSLSSIARSGALARCSVGAMASTIRVALENDYVLVLEGLRALLRSAPDIRVIEMGIQNTPHRRVDVTLLDTYGVEDLDGRIRDLVADPDSGAVVVFSFSDEPRLVRRVLRARATGF